ncbi:MAG: F0F1 ATP synthase subunit delta [Zoogloeaceae bacterium]|jgi:F-type H+-transporting ATPase subunit delta|nr:F0F1 ATP synthase subunit delta [Zoogloeaceae bacterium]
MAETITIARPYAEAAFRAAREAGTLAAWSGHLERLAQLAQDAQVARIIGHPGLSAEQLAELFSSFTQDDKEAKAAEDAVFDNFIRVLAENERLPLLPEITQLFEAQRAAEEGVKEALVETAFPVADATLTTLLQPELEVHFGTKLTLRVVVDAALIGGIRVTVGDQVLDASVRGKLEAMSVALKN